MIDESNIIRRQKIERITMVIKFEETEESRDWIKKTGYHFVDYTTLFEKDGDGKFRYMGKHKLVADKEIVDQKGD
jgi:dephospho-CoA kinase